MMDSMKERCYRMCGNDNNDCFMGNGNQIACISDMVINKVWPIKWIIDMAKKDNKCEAVAEFLDLASENMDELIDWVKYLQEQNRKQILEVIYK